MITRLGHVAIRVSDLEASLRFCRGGLGLQEVFWLNVDDGTTSTMYLYIAPCQFIELFVNGVSRLETGPDTVGLCHTCLEVPDIEVAPSTRRSRRDFPSVCSSGPTIRTAIRPSWCSCRRRPCSTRRRSGCPGSKQRIKTTG